MLFQLTAPLREPTAVSKSSSYEAAFQLTAPLREPTAAKTTADGVDAVSTHGSLAGATAVSKSSSYEAAFQLTAPLREPTMDAWPGMQFCTFQLTAPLREPTPYTICPLIRRCFNSRLPCGSRRKDSVLQTNFYGGFNSRLPCGSRLYETITGAATLRVSTHGSLAGADIVCGRRQPCTAVSTHGSLAGADVSIPPFAHSGGSFNSRLPCGSRLYWHPDGEHRQSFNSRLPCGSRRRCIHCSIAIQCFNSRLPCGSRLLAKMTFRLYTCVSTHGSLAGADENWTALFSTIISAG